MAAPGSRRWVFSAGHVPVSSTGEEPAFTSRDEVCILNLGRRRAVVELTVYHADRRPVGPYTIEVGGKRVCHVRINDLIDPQAVPLGVPYGIDCRSSRRVVIQLQRTDTRQAALSVSIAPAVAVGS